MNITEILTQPESKTLEFKRDLSSLKPILKTLVAFGMTIDEMKAGVSKVRNRMIARIMRLLLMMEEWGSGYKRIQEACLTGGYPEPEWQELGTAVRIIFRPHPEVEKIIATDVTVNKSNDPVNDPVNKRQLWFLQQLSAGKNVKPTDIAEHCSVAIVTAKRDIAELKNLGLIVFSGSPKTGQYRLSEFSDKPVS